MKKYKAQQITEFMLAIPLLIAFFAVLTEFAFAINTQLVLNNTLKSSVSAYNYKMSEINRNYTYPTGKEVELFIKENIKGLKLDENLLKVEVITVDKNPVVTASYTYKPGFVFSFLPALREIKMSAVAVFPYSFRDFSGYQSAINPANSEINEKTSYDFQPICKPCYVNECDKKETRSDPIYDKLGNIIDYNTYDVCVSECSKYQGDWWCVEDSEKECAKDLDGKEEAEHDVCH